MNLQATAYRSGMVGRWCQGRRGRRRNRLCRGQNQGGRHGCKGHEMVLLMQSSGCKRGYLRGPPRRAAVRRLREHLPVLPLPFPRLSGRDNPSLPQLVSPSSPDEPPQVELLHLVSPPVQLNHYNSNRESRVVIL